MAKATDAYCSDAGGILASQFDCVLFFWSSPKRITASASGSRSCIALTSRTVANRSTTSMLAL